MQCAERTIDFGKVTERKFFLQQMLNAALDVQSLGEGYLAVPGVTAVRALRFSPFAIRSSPRKLL
jgi:hypothetical protein